MGTHGSMNGFLTGGFNRTGRAGTIIDTGEEKEPGVSRAIEIDRQKIRDRNLDIEESRIINRGLRFRDIGSGEKSGKDKESPEAEKAEEIEVGKAGRIEVEKAGEIEVGEATRIRSNDI